MIGLALHLRGDAEADFLGVAFGVKREKAGQNFVAEVGVLQQAVLVGLLDGSFRVFLVIADHPNEALHVDPVPRFEVGELLGRSRGQVQQAVIDDDIEARLVVGRETMAHANRKILGGFWFEKHVLLWLQRNGRYVTVVHFAAL